MKRAPAFDLWENCKISLIAIVVHSSTLEQAEDSFDNIWVEIVNTANQHNNQLVSERDIDLTDFRLWAQTRVRFF